MESEEALKYYLDEVKNTQHDINNIVVEVHIPNEAEQATDFLQKAGLSDLTKIYYQGREITENVVVDSVRQRNLTEKQAQTIRFRVKTLNRTLRNRQPRRKQRQDVRDVAWNVETSSTGTRSRSATPDSLDSGEVLNDDLTSDEDQQLNSIPFGIDHPQPGAKTRIKWTSSEPLQNKKFNRIDKGDVAHLGSENVILKGYQVLSENGTLPRPQRERSGSDPTTEVHFQPLKTRNETEDLSSTQSNSYDLSQIHNGITVSNNCTKVYLNAIGNNLETVSFENLIRQNDDDQFKAVISESIDIEEGVSIDELSDSEYQYLKPLLYVELVAIFDQYKLGKAYPKRKTIKNKGGNVFGVNLSTLVMRDMPTPTDNCMVPKIFQRVLHQLNSRCISEDGILRIAGQKQKLDILCNEIEAHFYSNIDRVENLLAQAPVHDLTGVLKKLLRELPDPIFTVELFEMFFKASEIPDCKDKLRALNLLILMLPIEHRNTFKVLLEFFQNIVDNERFNRMNLRNVAMITAPSFFPPKYLLPKEDKIFPKILNKEEITKQINGAAVCCCTMEIILAAGHKMMTIPKSLVDQAREAQKQAQVRKDLSKDQDKRTRSGKTKLVRSSTQYEAGPMNIPKVKHDFYV